MNDWTDPVSAIEVRIEAFRRDGRPEVVTAPDAEELAALTWRSARDEDGAVPLDAALAVARLYWYRHQALAPRAADDDTDLGAAVAVFAMIDPVAPQAVPDELRELVDEARSASGSEPFDDAAAKAVDLLQLVQIGQEPDRLDEVIERFRILLAALVDYEKASGDSVTTTGTRAAVISNLSLALHLRVERTGDRADITEALRLARASVQASVEDDDFAAVLGNAATVHGTSFEYTGDPVELDQAIALGVRAVERSQTDSPQWARWASNLSGMYRVRFDRNDDIADLRLAIDLGTWAAQLTPDDSPMAGLRWCNVSNALDARYGWTRDPADLKAAIEAARRALYIGTAPHPDRRPIMANVAHLCLTRFEQWGEVEDVDESIALGQKALDAGTLSPTKRAVVLSNLANAHRLRYEHLHEPADLDRALRESIAAVGFASPGDPFLASRLTNHAMTLLCDFEFSGRPESLTEAVAAARAATDVSTSRPSLRSKLFSNLAVVLASCAGAARDPADRIAGLDEAVESGRQAVDTLPPDHPDAAIRMINLAGTLLDRSRASPHGIVDVRAAVDFYRRAADVVTASKSVRIQAARSRGIASAANGDWAQAVAGYQTGVGLLDALVTRAITRPSREILLHRFAMLPSEAGACAVAAQSVASAVELLEHSRAVLWSQALDAGAARTLRTAEAPLARRLAEVAAELA